jgi:large subunit ribosomal protein L11
VRTKKILQEITVNLRAGDASMVDLGKALGPSGVNLREIKREYDEMTAAQRGDVIPVVVTVFDDRSHRLRYKTPPTAFLIRQSLGIAAGAARPGGEPAGRLSREQLRSVARRKLPDLNTSDVEVAMRIVAGTARSMGILVTD